MPNGLEEEIASLLLPKGLAPGGVVEEDAFPSSRGLAPMGMGTLLSLSC
jgi:hypothetical protein